MKRWISVALWLCLSLLIGGYVVGASLVYWHLRAANDPVQTRLRAETPIAALATSQFAKPSVVEEYAARNILSRDSSQTRIVQPRVEGQRVFVSELGFVSNLADSQSESPLRSDPQVVEEFTTDLADWGTQPSNAVRHAQPRFVANSTQSIPAASPHTVSHPSRFDAPSSFDERPPSFAQANAGEFRSSVSPASHHQSIPRFGEQSSSIQDTDRHANPSPVEVTNPMDGMKVAAIISTRHELLIHEQQRMLGGRGARVTEASVTAATAEIKIYAESLSLTHDQQSDDQQSDQPADGIAAESKDTESNDEDQGPTPDDEAETNSETSDVATDSAAASMQPPEQVNEEPKPAPLEFQIVCKGAVAVVTPNGLIRGEDLRYANGQFTIGSAVIENPDTVITAGDITFPFEIGNVQVFPLGPQQQKATDAPRINPVRSRASELRRPSIAPEEVTAPPFFGQQP